MADGKNSIIVYRDWKKIFDELSDDEAGKLIKHFFSYVNDENPILDDKYLKMAFLPIKSALQRDLKHWESVKERRSESGRIGGLKSGETRSKHNQSEANEANASTTKQNEANEAVIVSDSVIVNDNVIDSVNENEYKKVLLSEIKISDFPKLNNEYFKIAKSFFDLFRSNIINAGAKTNTIDKAKGCWIDDIRLLIEADGYTVEDLRDVHGFLKRSDFWKKNILSTSKLREQIVKLKLDIQNERTKADNGQKHTSNGNDANQRRASVTNLKNLSIAILQQPNPEKV